MVNKPGPDRVYSNRIQVGVDDRTFDQLKVLAVRELTNVATVARKLIAEALEAREQN